MANLSNVNNKLLVGTNGEVRIGDTATIANVKLRVKQTAQQWIAQFVNTDSSVAYGISIDTSASSYGVAGTLQCYTNSGGGFIVRNDSKVGIGTPSPTSKIDVREDANNVYTGYFYNSSTAANAHGINVQTATTNSGAYAFRVNSASNSNALAVMGNARVGIGTALPDYTLHLLKSSGDTEMYINGQNGQSSLRMGLDARNWQIKTAAAPYLWSLNYVGTDFQTPNIITATVGGNVGIGISPSKKLTVFGTGAGNATVQIEGEGGADPYINFLANNAQHWSLGIDDSDSDKFKLSEHSALGTNDYFVVDTSGNVGIGTNTPTQKLEVTGNFKLNGTTVQEGTSNNLTFKYRTTHSNAYTGGNATCKFGRFYWTPAHWVNVAPVIKVTLHCKYYQGERREYIIKAGYQDTNPIINELQPSSTSQKITLVVGATTAAGYNYANQPVYYVDLQWVQTSYIWGWAQIESQVPFLTSNPTSGWGGVVTDSGLTQTNGSGLVANNNSFFAGNVGIGTASPGAKLVVNDTTDGNKIRLEKSGALVGSLGTYNGVPYIGYQGGAGGGIMFNGASIEPTALGSSRTNNTNDIGSSSYRWRNAYLGGGIYLGGTASQHKLDFYKTDTWAPQIYYQNATDQANATNSTQTGIYTKIGNVCTVQFRLIWTITGTPAVDNIGIKNLPFGGHGTQAYAEVPCILIGYAGGPSPRGNLTLTLPGSNQTLALFNDTNNVGNMGNAIGSGTKEIRFSFTYLTN